MMAIQPRIVADFEVQLATAISIGATSFSISSNVDDDGNTLTNGLYYFTLDNGSSSKEYLAGTLTGTAVTAVVHVSRQGVETSGATKAHRVGATVILTDFATYQKYMDNAALSGAVDATTVTKGIGTVSVAPAGATPIFVGDNDGRVPTQGENDGLAATTTPSSTNKFITQKDFQKGVETYAADAGSTDAYAITLSPAITAYANGMVFRFKANTVNTGAATLNINSLGAKAIVKNFNVALADGDIKASQIVEVQYESVGDNFQLLSPVSNTITANSGTTTHDLSVNTANTIAHGLGAIPKIVKVTMMYSQGNTDQSSTRIAMTCAVLTNATQSAVSVFHGSGDGATGSDSSGGATFTIRTEQGGNDYYQTATLTADATNITLSWSKNGSPTGTAVILWEAIV